MTPPDLTLGRVVWWMVALDRSHSQIGEYRVVAPYDQDTGHVYLEKAAGQDRVRRSPAASRSAYTATPSECHPTFTDAVAALLAHGARDGWTK